MKKQLILWISLLLALTLALSSCTLVLPPDLGGGTGNTDELPDTGNEGGDKGDDENGGNENDPPVTPPEIVLPTLPDIEGSDFGEYTTYYLFETENENFTLYAHQQNETGEFRTIPLTGTFTEEDGNYTLTYDSGECGYGKYYHGTFVLTDANFVSTEEVDTRGGNGITKVEITPSQGGTDFGYRDLAYNQNGEGMQAFYRDMLDACLAFNGNFENIPITADYCKISELNFAKYGISAEEAQSVWSVFRAENPSFYWLDTVCYYTTSTFYLTISPEYSIGEYRKEYLVDIYTMLTEAKAYIKNAKSDLERALLLHDFIILRIEYAYKDGTKEPETASWAHNILGAARVGKGVCETYAKTYQFLCQSVGIPTLFVTGYAGEPHAWNLIYLDGEWVGVDVTWDDMNGEHFLTSHFGLSASALAKEHTQDKTGGVGTEYHFKTPIVSPFGLSLCLLYDTQGNVTLCKNLDTALSLMTDKNEEYTVKYFNYTENGAYTVAPPDITYYISKDALPEVKSVFIGGEYYTQNVTEATVYLSASAFRLTSPLTLEDTKLTASHKAHSGLASQDIPLYGQGRLTLDLRATLNALYVDGECVLSDHADIQSLFTNTLVVNEEENTVLIHALTLTGTDLTVLLNNSNTYIQSIECADLENDVVRFHIAEGASLSLLSRYEGFFVSVILVGGKNAHLTRENFLTMNEYSKDTALSILTLENGKIYDRTDFFTLDENYRVVRKELTILENMIVSGNTLLSYTGTEQEPALPSYVTHIGSYAFADNDLPFLTLPDGITHILRGAFYGSSLREISLPNTLVFFDAYPPDDPFATPAPVLTYTYRGTYAEWARMIALSGDFVLYFSTIPNLNCTDGKGLFNATIRFDEAKPFVAVSDPLQDLTSTTGIRGKRMHHIAYDENGNATITEYDVYSSGAHGRPEKLADVTLEQVGDDLYTFRLDTTTYYIRIANGVLTYTDADGNPISDFPTRYR